MNSDSNDDKKRQGDIIATTKPIQNKNKKRKRKRSKTLSKEELHNLEVNEHYSKLLHQSTKILRKATKLSKAFECQKIVRKIKASMTSLNDKDDHSNNCNIHTAENLDDANTNQKLKKRVKSLEEKLKYIKSIDLEDIVQVCVNRLGLNSLNPSKVENDKDNNDSESVDGNKYINQDETSSSEKYDSTVKQNDKEYRTLIESIIQQKKVVSAMESINEFMLDYNRWLARKEEWLFGGNISSKSQKRKDRSNNNNSMDSKPNLKNNNRSMIDTNGHEINSGLFITSLAGNDIEYDDEIADDGQQDDREGQDYDLYTDFVPNKKNRMGQRARKARAMALEAKKQGKYEAGIKNWWEMKPKNPRRNLDNKNDLTASGLDISKNVKAAEVVQMGSKWKEAGNAHPSWAARQVQKEKSGTGIGNIEFKGKKITFD